MQKECPPGMKSVASKMAEKMQAAKKKGKKK
jgi:hypothetical protein